MLPNAVKAQDVAIKPQKDVYTIAFDSTYAPFEFQDVNGEYVGIDVDLIDAITNMYGFKVNKIFPGFQAAVDQTLAGQADGIMAGMSITDERKKVFDFADPYFETGIQMAVRADNVSIQKLEDLKGLRVGVKNGTIAQQWITDNQEKYGYTVKTFDDGSAMYDALEIKDIQAFMDASEVLNYAIAQGRDFKTPFDNIPVGSYGFAVKKGTHPELIAMFNSGLKKLKASGEYDRIVAKYMGGKKEVKKGVDESTFSGLITNNWKQLFDGLWKTILMALISFSLAMVLGTLIGLLSVAPSKAARIFSTVYVDIIRGLPLMVLAFFLFYALPQAFPLLKMSDLVAGVLALTLNASAYIAEIVRGGISAVPKGQMEASRSLGLSYSHTMQKIILPQAIKIMIPSFVNQFVISLKDTTIISVLGVIELLQTGKIIVARNFQSFKVYLIIGIMYLIVITALTKLSKVLEKKVA
ncbi:MAG: amino acid ABC transporter substrate-binding protein/permease [Streptococcaceae bacterium]|nr:amino acid ABC transporter substrate-binding protein/permease [Streptococcaceae bacterium]